MLRFKARGQRDQITVLGHAAMISAGEFVQASGIWMNDRTHGVQFRASFLKVTAPTTVLTRCRSLSYPPQVGCTGQRSCDRRRNDHLLNCSKVDWRRAWCAGLSPSGERRRECSPNPGAAPSLASGTSTSNEQLPNHPAPAPPFHGDDSSPFGAASDTALEVETSFNTHPKYKGVARGTDNNLG